VVKGFDIVPSLFDERREGRDVKGKTEEKHIHSTVCRIRHVLKDEFVKELLARNIGCLAILIATAWDERRTGSSGIAGKSSARECRVGAGVECWAGTRDLVLSQGLVRHPDEPATTMDPSMCWTNFMDVVGIGNGEET
jgi:hypothetical protein